MGAEGTSRGRGGHGPAQAVGSAPRHGRDEGGGHELGSVAPWDTVGIPMQGTGTRPGMSLVPKGWMRGPTSTPGLCPALPLHRGAL